MIKKALLLLLLGALLMASCQSSSNNEQPKALYKSAEGQNLSYHSYDEAMKLWPVQYEEEWVETDYGKSHVIISGREDARPLFLLPALFSDATLWYSNVERLSQEYRVYALDMINYGGKSLPAGKSVESLEDYAVWFESIVKHYGYDSVAVGGLSYCSWLTLALANSNPELVSAMFLIDPSTTFMRMDGGIGWRGFWAFSFFPTPQKKRDFFSWMGGGYTDPDMEIWFKHMMNVVEYSSVTMYEIPQHKTYQQEELTNVTMPTLILIGGKKILYKSPEKLADAARTAIPHANVQIVDEGGHLLNIDKSSVVNERVLAFLAENY